jgi:DNA-binding transcriptional ArsR family regulator
VLDQGPRRRLALSFFRSLADETRLRMLGVLATRECSVEELAAMLEVKPPTISQHLRHLRVVGLVDVRAEGTSHLYRLDMSKLRALVRETTEPEKIVAFGADVEADAWERQVLDNFFRGERLKEIPASLKKRRVVLKWLTGRFEAGVGYPEARVNEVLQRHHPDFAALRRYLVDEGFMERQAGDYRRSQTPE